jgi:hypothetical protein
MMVTRMMAITAVILVAASAAAAAAMSARDPLTGAWVAIDVAGDGSTDRYIFSAPNKDGVRNYTLVDSYGSFCETDGPGTGAPLTAHGTATLDGTTVHTTFESFACGNGTHGTFNPPLAVQSELTSAGLNVDGYYIAVRAGE